MRETVRVAAASWDGSSEPIMALRAAVFIDEQGVPVELEWDGLDPRARHVLALSPEDEPIGTGRLLPDGQIGRMAVAAAWRGCGVGRRLLRELLAVARRDGHRSVWLNAQVAAIGFYEGQGFTAEGPEFDDAGIPHRRMTLAL